MRGWQVLLCVFALITPSGPAAADGVVRYVALTGTDAGSCNASAAPCRTIQYAVAQSQPGDEIRVAGGVYGGAQTVTAIEYSFTQVVFIDHSLTVLGGYTAGDWSTAQPATNPTVIDAAGVGRAVTVVDTDPGDGLSVAVTLAGLVLTGGNYSDLGTSVAWPDSCPRSNSDCGGGLFARGVQLIVRDSTLRDNIANDSGSADPARRGDGGGAMLVNLTAGSCLERVQVLANEATAANGQGGGVYVSGGADLTIIDSPFVGNHARAAGAALYLSDLSGAVTVRGGAFESNQIEGPTGVAGALSVANTSGPVRLERLRFVGNSSAARAAALSVTNSARVEVLNGLLWNNTSGDPDRASLVTLTGGSQPNALHLVHTTAIDNGVRFGVLATSASGAQTVALTNTVVVSAAAAVGAEAAGGPLTVSVSHAVHSDVAETVQTVNGSPTVLIGPVINASPALDSGFRPLAGSPVIDAGAQAGVPNDYFGQGRVGAPDIGYAEFSGSPPPSATPSRTATVPGAVSPTRTATAPGAPSPTPSRTATPTVPGAASPTPSRTTPPPPVPSRTPTATTVAAGATATNDRQPQDQPLRVWLPAITKQR
jgi:hypothetical protein